MADAKPPIRPEDSLAKMIASLPEKTGKSLDEWKQVIAREGWKAHGEIMKGLKGEHGISHSYANQIALRVIAKEDGGDPVEEMFAKRPEVRPIYDAVLTQILAFGADIDLAPKKGYMSVRRSKQFAILQPAAGRLDVGIQLKDVSPEGRLEASGSFNAMLSHRVKVSGVSEVDGGLVGWLKAAYERA